MKRVKAAAWMAAGVTLVATAVAGTMTPAHAATAYRLSVSTHPNHSHAVSLAGQALHGNVYIFATPGSGALRVKFYVDDPKRKKLPIHTETSAPYDLLGGDPGRPHAYKTTGLKNGKHTLTIAVDLPLNQKSLYTATFTVKNVPPKPHGLKAKAGTGVVKVSWHSGGGITSGFYVYRSTHAHVPLSHPLNHLPLKKTARSYVDAGVKSGVRYYYVVQAVGSTHGRSSSGTIRSGTVKASTLKVVSAKAMGTAGRVTVSWSIHGTPQQIRIYRSKSTTVSLKTPVKTLPASTRSWADTKSLTSGTLYRYVVELVAGTRKVHSSALTATPLAAPAGVTATGGSSGITVHWTGGATGVTSYGIYRSTSTQVPLTTPLHAASASSSSWLDTSFDAGTTYYYVVQARSLHGHAETTATLTPTGAPVLNPTTSGDAKVFLVWTAPTTGGTVIRYDVYRGTSGADAITHAVVHTQPANDVNWTDTAVSNDTTYFYVVRAIAVGGSADSGAQQATPVKPPVLSTVTLDGGGHPVLSWDTDSTTPATRYRIFRDTSSSVSMSSELTHVATSTHTYTDTTADTGKTYYYLVQAWFSSVSTGSGNANSSTSNAVNTPQTAAANLATALDVDGVHVTWDAVDGNATSVEVYRSGSQGDLGSLLSGGTLDPSVTEYTDSDTLTPGDTLFYTVRVIGPGGHTDSAQVEYDVPV